MNESILKGPSNFLKVPYYTNFQVHTCILGFYWNIIYIHDIPLSGLLWIDPEDLNLFGRIFITFCFLCVVILNLISEDYG